MTKYETLYKNIYSIFNTPEWIALNFKLVPENFYGTGLGDEYLRLSIIANGANPVGVIKSVSGQLIFDIFTKNGVGNARILTIADLLDTNLCGKNFLSLDKSTTQLYNSALTVLGTDAANPSLLRASYSIPFSHFGL